MAHITLYTTGCPNCMVLEHKMKEKGVVPNKVINRQEEIMEAGFMSVPILKVDDEIMTFVKAISWINER